MKLGSETGSLMNHVMSRMTKGMPEPEVGMGATILLYSDRHAATVVAWNPKTRVVTVQNDHAKRSDNNGMSDCQDHTYTPNPDGSLSNFRFDNGNWREVVMSTSGRWKLGGGFGLLLGRRDQFYNFTR